MKLTTRLENVKGVVHSMTFLSLQLVESTKIIGGLYPGGIVCVIGCHVTSRNQGLSSNDQGRQRRETLGMRLPQRALNHVLRAAQKECALTIVGTVLNFPKC